MFSKSEALVTQTPDLSKTVPYVFIRVTDLSKGSGVAVGFLVGSGVAVGSGVEVGAAVAVGSGVGVISASPEPHAANKVAVRVNNAKQDKNFFIRFFLSSKNEFELTVDF